jgi:hypothetical protein
MDHAVSDLSKIAGQKPVVTKSKKAIAGFKIRDGVPIGCMVTLRGVRMYEFLDRFVTIALPRVRDFRGISSRAFDGRGNYNIGVKEQIIFPELDYDKIDVAPRLEHLDHDDGQDRRGVPCAPHRVQVPVQDLKDRRGKDLPDPARAQARATGGQVREEVRRAEGRGERRQEVRRRPLRRPARAAEAAAQRLPDAPAQPLRHHRPPARHFRKFGLAATRSASWRSRATFPASSRRAGKAGASQVRSLIHEHE